MIKESCGIKHGHGGQVCIRAKDHDGLCRSRAERSDGKITYSEWLSKDGKYFYHIGYRTIYPANATKSVR